MNNGVKITPCKWPIPDDKSESGFITNCLNFQLGCWLCTFEKKCNDTGFVHEETWCYMRSRWNQWKLAPQETKTKTDLAPLTRQLNNPKFQLRSNLGISSSHDPLHDDCIDVFERILLEFDKAERLDWKNYDRMMNGHVLHIQSKKLSRLLGFIDIIDLDSSIWATLTTPCREQSRGYQMWADDPFTIAHTLKSLHTWGWDNLGVSFGPLFGEWRDEDKRNKIFDRLPPLKAAQFEKMNHGNNGLDVLTLAEMKGLARLFKMKQPDCKVYVKGEGATKVGKLIE